MERIKRDRDHLKELALAISQSQEIDYNTLLLSSTQDFLTFTRKWAREVLAQMNNKPKKHGR